MTKVNQMNQKSNTNKEIVEMDVAFTNGEKITFQLDTLVSMSQKRGEYRTGKKWQKWSQIFRGTDGVLYQSFQQRAIRTSKDITIEGTYNNVSPFPLQGRKGNTNQKRSDRTTGAGRGGSRGPGRQYSPAQAREPFLVGSGR